MGFLKYYHPNIAAGKYNWDFELFRILPQILTSKGNKQRDQLLSKWIDQFGDISKCGDCEKELPSNAKILPDLEWLKSSDFSPGLKEKLLYIYQNRNQEENYYVELAPGVGNPVFKGDDAYPQFEYPDAGFRLLAVYRYWNIIQYFFPYKNLIEEDWKGVLKEFIPRFIKAKDALNYRLVSLELIGRIHDTHANLWMRDSLLTSWKGKLQAPVQVKFIEDQAVVTGYFHDTFGPGSGLLPGDIITTIEGKTVSEIVRERQKFYPASNQVIKLRDIARSLLRGNEENLQLTIRRAYKEMTVNIQRYERAELDESPNGAYNKPDSCYQLLSEDIGYIYLGNIKSDLLPTIFEQFKDTKGIVIDIRNYPSEFVVFSLGKYLMPEPTDFVKFTKGDIQTPGLFDGKYTLKVGEKKSGLL